MPDRVECEGSNKWGPGEDVLGKGRCRTCGQLVYCNSSGILSPHWAKEVAGGVDAT